MILSRETHIKQELAGNVRLAMLKKVLIVFGTNNTFKRPRMILSLERFQN